ncbi:Cell division protein FtsL [Corynebacterium provencense]|jgi:cell division protein FtsB|uniref:Cell division protein FtsL n=1 Tax=Corynebacterium provencense TaxID=1737425 RepID=A0A2Z3YT01_9CORY|nr:MULTISPECIES: septum formation initiator family protein [Corynebacterium]AWT25724.1 Cell division protein FtsL [Corynebacterium provencense]MCI1257304.1 septum formation initiator family protein [Corynebacterium provencense]
MEETPDRSDHLPAPKSTEERTRRVRAAKDAPRKVARSFVQLKSSVNPVVVAVSVLVLAAVVVSVATPLRNFFEQRAAIAEVNATIERQEAEKQALTEEIARYGSEAYVREQARTRLGLVEPGETAYRLMDPDISSGADYVPGEVEETPEPEKPWYSRLWGAVATPPEPAAGGGEDSTPPPSGESPNLPVDPGADPQQ